MKPGKVIDKTKGPVKVAGPSKAAKPAKQSKMGHAKKAQALVLPPCPKGHPTQTVHYTLLGNMRRWCPTCQELQ